MEKSAYQIKTMLEEKLNRKVNVSISDIKKLIEAKKENNYSEVYKTKLYNDQSMEYCLLNEILFDEPETCVYDYSKTFRVDDVVKFKMVTGQEKIGNYRGKIDENICCVVVDHQNWQVRITDLYR